MSDTSSPRIDVGMKTLNSRIMRARYDAKNTDLESVVFPGYTFDYRDLMPRLAESAEFRVSAGGESWWRMGIGVIGDHGQARAGDGRRAKTGDFGRDVTEEAAGRL